ncbi:MAG TPA: hypothetical protein VG929_02520 [Actinomycetota bacterium]|nr:hypothetical protein [Actinomycetota bacterium]
MRIAIVVASVLGLLALAGPAAAQRDPFDPVIDPNAAVTTTTGTTTTGTTTTGTGTTSIQPGVGSEGLANTGADVSPYLVVAYGLVVVGAGALYLAKLHAPRPTQR